MLWYETGWVDCGVKIVASILSVIGLFHNRHFDYFIVGGAQVLLTAFTMALFKCLSKTMRVWQWVSINSKAAKQSLVIFQFIINTCAFLTVDRSKCLVTDLSDDKYLLQKSSELEWLVWNVWNVSFFMPNVHDLHFKNIHIFLLLQVQVE